MVRNLRLACALRIERCPRRARAAHSAFLPAACEALYITPRLSDDPKKVGEETVRKLTAAIAALLLLAGCASRSADIAPAYVSPIQYQSYSCSQLAAEAQRVSAAAAAASGAQDSQATKDAVVTTAAVIVFWPAAFFVGGDKQTAAQLAQLKGQMDAIQQEAIAKKCNIQFQTAPAPAPKS